MGLYIIIGLVVVILVVLLYSDLKKSFNNNETYKNIIKFNEHRIVQLQKNTEKQLKIWEEYKQKKLEEDSKNDKNNNPN